MAKNEQNVVEDQDQDDGESFSLSTCIVNLPVIVTVTEGGKSWPLNLAAIPDGDRTRIVGHLVGRGLKISLSNPYSTTKGTKAEKETATKKRLDDLQNGTFTAKGGGGRAQLSPERKGWIAWFTARKVQEQGKPVTANTLDRAMLGECRRAMLACNRATPETAATVAEAELPKWTAWMEENNPVLKEKIEGFRKLANPAIVENMDYSGYPG